MWKRRAESGIGTGINMADGHDPDASHSKTFSIPNFQSTLVQALSGRDRYVQVLVFLTILGAFLRFYHLDYNSLWLDEAATYSYAQKSFLEIWGVTSGGEYNPPLFYWFEHMMLFFGSSEFILRLIPAILGVMTIPLFYLIGKELVDQNTGIITAALLSFSPFPIYYSQEARAYASALFLVSLALIFYLYAHRSHELKYWILFGVFSALAFWTHFYSIVITGALILFELIMQARNAQEGKTFELKPILFALTAFVVLCAPLLIVTVRLFLIRTSARPTFGSQGIKLITNSIYQIFGYNNIAEYILVVLFVIGIFQIFRTKKAASFMLVMVIAVAFFVSLFLSYKMPMLPRYLIPILPFLYVGVAAAHGPIYKIFSHHAVIYLFIIGLIAVNLPFLQEYYSNYSKSDWNDFAVELQNVTKDGDMVVVIPEYLKAPLDYYYSNASDRTIECGASTAEDLNRLYTSRRSSRIFLVSTDDIFAADSTGKSFQWLGAHSFLIKIVPKTADKITPKIWLYQTMNESDPLAWYNKGLALYRSGKYNESLQAHNKAIEIAPKFASAWYNRGLALYKLGKYNESLQAYNKTIELVPKSAYAWYNKGVVLKVLGHTEGAEAAFTEARALFAKAKNETIRKSTTTP